MIYRIEINGVRATLRLNKKTKAANLLALKNTANVLNFDYLQSFIVIHDFPTAGKVTVKQRGTETLKEQ